MEVKDNAILFYSFMSYLSTTNTLLIVQTIKKSSDQLQSQSQLKSESESESELKSKDIKRQYWAIIPPCSNINDESYNYQIESMFMIQLCDQESILTFSNYPAFLSFHPPPTIQSNQQNELKKMNENNQDYQQEMKEQENEVKEFIETSIRLLGTIESYNPLAFPSHISQIITIEDDHELNSLKIDSNVISNHTWIIFIFTIL